MARQGTLTQAEKNSIQIDQFIFHIIITAEAEPRYLSRVELEPAQRAFFCDRIAESAEGTQFKFRDKAIGTALRCSRIIDEPANNFHGESKEMALDFYERHHGNVNDGAFIIAIFTADIDGARLPFIALLKMDHQKVLEYTIREERGEQIAKMSEILNSFVESKAAVQKSAIVDISDHFTWDVLAHERNNTKGIADYFRTYLSATEVETPSHLTRTAVSAVSRWARETAHDLPDERRQYRSRAVQYMETHDAFDTDAFLDMVVRDEDADRKAILVQELRTHLDHTGVAGQRFAPMPGSLPTSLTRTKLKTAEGVSIIWEGTEEAANVEIDPVDQDGMRTIRIKTQNITDVS